MKVEFFSMCKIAEMNIFLSAKVMFFLKKVLLLP